MLSADSKPSRSQPRKKYCNCLAGQGFQTRQQTRAFQKSFKFWLRKVVTTTDDIACFPTCTGNSSKLKVRHSVVVGQPLALHTSSAASYTRPNWLRKVVTTTDDIACFPTCTGNSSKLKVRHSVVVGQPLALHTSSAASYTRPNWLRKVVAKTVKWLDSLLVQANQA